MILFVIIGLQFLVHSRVSVGVKSVPTENRQTRVGTPSSWHAIRVLGEPFQGGKPQ